MNDDILLTSEECAEIVHDAQNMCSRCEGCGRLWADGMAHYYDHNRPTRTCPVCGGTGLVSGDDAYEAICRSQLRKVVEWALRHNEADCFIHKDGRFDARLVTGTVVLWPTEVAALRKAAGEGK